MVDRKKSLDSFLKMLGDLEQDKEKVRAFEIFFRDGRKLRLVLYEIKERKKLLLALVKGEKAG